MKTIAFFLTTLVPAIASAQEKPTTGYAPVNGLKMYYEVHGSGEPVVLLHGAFMTITNNWTEWIGELSKTRKVIAVEMQGHGRTADIERDISYENLADDVAALLDHLKIPRADLIGYSMGGGVAMQCAIRHPEKVRKVVSISAVFRHDGWVKEAARRDPETHGGSLQRLAHRNRVQETEPDAGRIPEVRQARHRDRLRRRLTTSAPTSSRPPRRRCSSSTAMPTACGSSTSAEMFRLKGGEIHRRHAAALRIAIGHFAQHNTRHADGPHGRDRPDGERLSRCQAAKAMRKRDSSLQARD